MQNIFIIIIVASLVLVGGGMAISDGLNFSAGPVARGEEAVLEAQADQLSANADQTRIQAEQARLDQVTFRQHWSKWMTTADQKLGGMLSTFATIFQVAGWIMGLATAFAYVRMANGVATSFNIFMLIRGVTRGVAPVHQKKGDVNSVFMPTTNRTIVMHDQQPDVSVSMSRRGTRQLQSGDPMTNTARAMANAHKTRSMVQGGENSIPFWQTLWQAVLQWRATRSAGKSVEVSHPKDDLFN